MHNDLLRKKINLLFCKLKIATILQLTHLQSVLSFAKKNIGQISAGTYKRNVTTAMMLAILPSFLRKNYVSELACGKTLLHILKTSSLMPMNHYIYYWYPALLQTRTTNHLFKK